MSDRARQLMKRPPATGLLVVALGELACAEGLQDADEVTVIDKLPAKVRA